LIGCFTGYVLESAGDAEFYAVWLPLTHIAFAADLVLIIEMDIPKGTSQAAHFASDTSLTYDLYRFCTLILSDRSRRADFEAPGIIALQASHGQAYFHVVVILYANIGIFPIEIPGLAKCACIFAIAANDAFPNIPSNNIHRACLPISLIY
jgi:hypothetical protein